MAGEGGSLPPATRNKLHKLFCLIEKEFESLYLENVALQERLDRESLGPFCLPERVGEEESWVGVLPRGCQSLGGLRIKWQKPG